MRKGVRERESASCAEKTGGGEGRGGCGGQAEVSRNPDIAVGCSRHSAMGWWLGETGSAHRRKEEGRGKVLKQERGEEEEWGGVL